jgi:hypothetical protein
LADFSHPVGTPNTEQVEPTDAELQRALVAAVLGGMAAAAATLAATIDERRLARAPKNVIDLSGRRGL